jgi:hypothetical protein
MGTKITPNQDAAIRGILSRVSYVPKQMVSWGIAPDGSKDWNTVRALTRELAAYNPSGSCMGCHFRALNILREAVDLPPVGGEASESLRTRRLAVCRGVSPDHSDACPAWHPSTDSCGRLLVDALSPDPVKMEDGHMVMPCGCAVSVKSAFRFFRCPANKWPNR